MDKAPTKCINVEKIRKQQMSITKFSLNTTSNQGYGFDSQRTRELINCKL